MFKIPAGFLTLRDAFASVGSKVLPAWKDDTLNPHLWVHCDPQKLAHWRWFEVTGWIEHEINSGNLSLWILDSSGKPERVKDYIGSRDAASFFLTGRFTTMSRQEALKWLETDQKSDEPLLLLEEAPLQAAVVAYLQPDETEYWSFSGLLAWICWRRYDKFREYATVPSDFVFEELRTYYSDRRGIVMSGPEGLRDLWKKLVNDKIRALAVPKANATRTEIPSYEFLDYKLGSENREDVLMFARPPQANAIKYYSPVVRRKDVLVLWPQHTVSAAARRRNIKRDEYPAYERALGAGFEKYVKEMRSHPKKPLPSVACDREVIQALASRPLPRELCDMIRQSRVPPEWQKSGDKRRVGFHDLARLTPPIIIGES